MSEHLQALPKTPSNEGLTNEQLAQAEKLRAQFKSSDEFYNQLRHQDGTVAFTLLPNLVPMGLMNIDRRRVKAKAGRHYRRNLEAYQTQALAEAKADDVEIDFDGGEAKSVKVEK
jgi:hypothetical protein